MIKFFLSKAYYLKLNHKTDKKYYLFFFFNIKFKFII